MTYLAPKGIGCLLAATQTEADNPGSRYLETSNFRAAKGTGCLPALSKTGTDNPGTRSLESPIEILQR